MLVDVGGRAIALGRDITGQQAAASAQRRLQIGRGAGWRGIEGPARQVGQRARAQLAGQPERRLLVCAAQLLAWPRRYSPYGARE